MITVEEALRRMVSQVPLMPVEECPLAEAGGRYTASDIKAPYDHPLFHTSAVDGYAFAFDHTITEWNVVGTVAAGDVFAGVLRPGECVRIFTGAMVPAEADTVVMQERVQRQGDRMAHDDVGLRRGANVRLRAEQVVQGASVLQQGGRLNASVIGLLATVGVRQVAVHRDPSVGLLLTGGEFIEGETPVPGRIFNSNGVMLATALHEEGLPSTEQRVRDEQAALDAALARSIATSDVVISTGGASVGDHDLVHAAVTRAGGTIHFHGVAQKPGKPMLFATVQGKPFFGLPGNPRAVMILYWEYVLPFLRSMRGAADPWPEHARLPLATGVRVKGARAEFRAARIMDGTVHLLADEGSHMLRTLAEGNAIVYLPGDRREWEPGDLVDVHRVGHQASAQGTSRWPPW